MLPPGRKPTVQQEEGLGWSGGGLSGLGSWGRGIGGSKSAFVISDAAAVDGDGAEKVIAAAANGDAGLSLV